MQSKLPEFFAQGKARQSQPARGFGLIAFRQQNGLRKDFAFGFSEHVGMGVLELAFLRPLQKITGAGGKGIAGLYMEIVSSAQLFRCSFETTAPMGIIGCFLF